MLRLLRSPLLHYLALGGVLFGLRGVFSNTFDDVRRPIVAGPAQIEQARQQWLQATGHPPEPKALRASLRDWADDEMLYREAVRLGLDRSDPVVRSRLLTNMRFAYSGSMLSADALLRQARALHMERRDIVVRRRLVEQMKLQFESAATVSEADVHEYVREHPQRYVFPARYVFRQIYFGDQRGAKALPAARQLLRRLRNGAPPPRAMDAFLLGDRFDWTREQVLRRFGADFASALANAPIGHWSGPFRSAFGWHLLWVERVESPRLQPYAAVRVRAAYDLLELRREKSLQDSLRALRRRYPLQVEGQTLAMGGAP